MHFLAERPAILGAEPAAETGELAGEAAAVIKEARRRRRRRRIRGTGAVLLVAAGATTWVLLEHPFGTPRAANNTAASRPTTAGGCASAIAYGSLPTWARAGFTPPSVAMPYALSAHGGIVAVLWARHDPLITPTPPGRNNKILWVSKLPTSLGSSLQITAQRLVGGTTVGAVQRRSVFGGPGPSLIDMPTAGCWQFTLRWSGHTDTLDLPYAAG